MSATRVPPTPHHSGCSFAYSVFRTWRRVQSSWSDLSTPDTPPPPKPSGESCPLEGELVGFVAEPEPCDFRGFPPCAVQGVKPWGGRTPAAKDPGTRQ